MISLAKTTHEMAALTKTDRLSVIKKDYSKGRFDLFKISLRKDIVRYRYFLGIVIVSFTICFEIF
jgi:hypothetical protein